MGELRTKRTVREVKGKGMGEPRKDRGEGRLWGRGEVKQWKEKEYQKREESVRRGEWRERMTKEIN